jgi:NAD-dependent deacetylase
VTNDSRERSDVLREAARALSAARSVAVLTGAGISAESGVPTFRGADGLWNRFRAEDLATLDAFDRNPALVWKWYRWRRQLMAKVSPNAGHEALARLEARFAVFTLVTQNIDGLHTLAGSRQVIEIHGSIWRDRCLALAPHYVQRTPAEATAADDAEEIPRCGECGSLLRPDVVWFGEMLDPKHLTAATRAFKAADVALVVGTSSVVYPAAALPEVAKDAGATLIEINPSPTPLTGAADLVLQGPSGTILPELERLLAQAT